MGSNPFASLSPVERDTYRTALAAHVVETVYRAAQQGGTLTLDAIVLGVRAVRPDAPTVEIHRAVAHVEYAGLIAPTITPVGQWRHVDQPPRLPRPGTVCPTPECLRPAGHGEDHLPDLNGDRLTAQLVVHGGEFVAAWSPGSPWVQVYGNATEWERVTTPVAVLPVPHTMRFTPDSLIELVTAWASRDTYVPPAADNRAYAYQPGVDNGTLIQRHADYCAVWDHDTGEVRFYESIYAWDYDSDDPIGRVDVPDGVPFTGAVLDQICDDWFDRETAKTVEESDGFR